MLASLQVHDLQVGEIDPQPAPPPLPGGAAEVVRFFMDVPQWIQIGGVLVGALTVLALLIVGWRRRNELLRWIGEIPTVVLATAVAVILAAGTVASVAGYQVYDFVEHDNRFCTGCHVMADAYVSFEQSAHVDLGCKACHAQPKTQSMRQLYLWVLDRPDEVGPHSPVSNDRCGSCHIDEDPEEWPQIAASMGHQLHFESDDPELEGLMCVECHGVSVHEFTPVDETCGECHVEESQIRLGAMADETQLHCVACHDFLGEEPSTIPGAPEGMALLPDRAECQSCHAMEGLLADSELDADPHGAVCGACHNPHEQDLPGDAVAQCTTCHEGSDTLTIFHTGTHAPVHAQCTECHSAHSWSVEGSDCQSCHTEVMGAVDGNPDPPDPLGVVGTTRPGEPIAVLAMHGGGNSGFPLDLFGGEAVQEPDTLPRPFLHRQHEGLSCVGCHGSETEHGVVTVRTPEDCAACHHAADQSYGCPDCHASAEFETASVPETLRLSVWDADRDRDLPFDHVRHEGLACRECHTRGVLLAPDVRCATCHEDHHRPGAECTLCHTPASPDAHGLEVHLTCTGSGCHGEGISERPILTRSFCLTCHDDRRDHEPGLECQDCHMVPTPTSEGTGAGP